MNEELQHQLAELMQSLLAVANDAAGFAKAQIPPLVQEKIIYGRVQHTALVLLFAVVTWRMAIYAQGFFREARAASVDRHSYDIWPERPGGLAFIICGIVCIVSSILVLVHFNYAAMAWFAPRLFIVEWLISLTKH